jgi:hypothetical protein
MAGTGADAANPMNPTVAAPAMEERSAKFALELGLRVEEFQRRRFA